jgi:DNA integrity scanning protein DisA with diadenylate cyclase activity
MATIQEIPRQLIQETARQSLQLVSLQFHTIAIYVEGPAALVYGSGELVQIRRDGKWIQPCVMQFKELIKEGFAPNILSRILNVCCMLSEKNIGGIFVVSAENEVKYCQPMNKECSFDKRPLDRIPDDQLIDFANIDGAIILDVQGEVLKIGQKLEAPEIVSYEVGSGRGTRHNSASKYSKATNSVVFVVSEDGPISLYYKGKLIGHCYEELFA